ncbi:hypothetical protein Ciccas_005724 [Cichlidogyrus casuarinus]|uniref:Uncharacterized protein n=1 Tax=Cichlidogyrus casuarinus TaxID=1844966 RepID=A0ABD2Q7U2_9PLAT
MNILLPSEENFPAQFVSLSGAQAASAKKQHFSSTDQDSENSRDPRNKSHFMRDYVNYNCKGSAFLTVIHNTCL